MDPIDEVVGQAAMLRPDLRENFLNPVRGLALFGQQGRVVQGFDGLIRVISDIIAMTNKGRLKLMNREF